MNTFTVTATELKRNPADILNRVAYERKTALVERHGKIIAEISPTKTAVKKNTKDLQAIWDSFGGSMPDFPDVKKARYFSQRRFKGL